MTNVNDVDTDIAIGNDKTSYISELTTIAGKLKGIARIINDSLTQSGVRGESPIEPDGTSKTS